MRAKIHIIDVNSGNKLQNTQRNHVYLIKINIVGRFSGQEYAYSLALSDKFP